MGSNAPNIDAETILLAKTLLDKLGVTGYTLYINSIGCKECRAKYHKALKEYLSANLDKLCGLCQDRYVKNPMRILDCKNPDCKEITKGAPQILDYICDDCKNHFEQVKSLLTTAGVPFTVDAGIVRGLDYYTKTVFEFVSNNIGAQGTICGGGRYDGLISQLGGNDVPGVGFALGIERLLLLMENIGLNIPNLNLVKLYIAPMGEEESKKAFELATALRMAGICCEFDHMGRGIKSQFKYADKIGAKMVGVIGSSELEKGVIKVKTMETGSECEVAFVDLVDYVKNN